MAGTPSEDLETHRFVVKEAQAGLRLDRALALLAGDFSRSRLQGLIRGGALLLNGSPCADVAQKVAGGQVLELRVPPPEPAVPQAENIPSTLFTKTRICW